MAADRRTGLPSRLLTGLYRGGLLLSLLALLTLGVSGPSAASPGLGPRGWAPGTLGLHLGPAAVTAVLWGAYLLGAAAIGCGLVRPGARVPHGALVPALAVAALLTSPFGSADHTNYAAYGRIAASGGDPYVVPPVSWHGGSDPVTSAVEPPWTRTPSIYGPFATLLQAGTSHLGGANLRQTVWVWQLLVVASWLAVRALLLRTARDGERRRVELLWTWNPVLFGVAVLGAHVDVLATALGIAAVVVASRAPWAGGLLLGLVVSTKLTYAVVALAVLWSWRSRDRTDLLRRILALAAGALVVAVPLHWEAGRHVFDQLLRARRSVSLATPWRIAVDVLTGPVSSATVRSLVSAAAVLVTLLLAAALAVLVRRAPVPRQADVAGAETVAALRATFVLATAYTLGAPYSLPWYDALTWATLPSVAATGLDLVLLGRLAVMALAYVPGRVVGLSPGVQDFSLGVRRHVAPYAGLAVWALVTTMARHRPTRSTRSTRSTRRPPSPPGDATDPMSAAPPPSWSQLGGDPP